MSKDVKVSIIKELNFTGSIVSISFLDNAIVMIDSFFNLYMISNESFDLIRSIKLVNSKEGIHKYSKSIASSHSGFVAFPDEHTDLELTFLLRDNMIEPLKHLSWHTSSIEVSEFSLDSKYLATGGQDGKTFIFDVPTLELITSIPNRPDFISSISFSKNSKYLAVSAFDKNTIIFDLTRMVTRQVIQTKDVVEASAFFDNDTQMFLIAQNGSGAIFDFEEDSMVSVANHFNSWPTVIEITEDNNFAVVGTRKSFIYIIRLSDNQKLLEVDMEAGGISFLKIYKNNIIIAFTSGHLKILEFDKHLDELKDAIGKKDYPIVKEILDKNIFLRIHPYYDEFNKAWGNILLKAVELIAGDRLKAAIELVQPFVTDDEKKQDEFNIYLMKKDIMQEFVEIINKEDYKNAYTIANDNDYLKSTKAYLDLERKWLSTFEKAKKYLEEDAKLNENIAKKLLSPFTSIDEKKNLISNLLKNAILFKNAEEMIKRRNFKGYFELVKKNAFLKETELYKKVVTLGDSLLEQLVGLENDENYKEAKNVADMLVNFSTHFIAAKEKMALIKDKELLVELVNAQKYNEVCELVYRNPTLSATSHFKRVENRFSAIFEEAKKDAYDGNVQSVIGTIGAYFKIGYWQDRVANVIKIGYVSQIRNARQVEYIDWEKTLLNYVIRFGVDAEIEKIATNYDNLNILESVSKQANFFGYRKHNFLEDIVFRK